MGKTTVKKQDQQWSIELPENIWKQLKTADITAAFVDQENHKVIITSKKLIKENSSKKMGIQDIPGMFKGVKSNNPDFTVENMRDFIDYSDGYTDIP